MILFSSKTRTPLAALTLKSVNDIGCLSMLTGRPAPKDSSEPHFQGMLSMPNQSFNFVITNLSDDGMINFNILHTPHRVSNVNPGPAYGINEVNELDSNQSYEVEADQRTNRVMVLKGKTTEKYDPITKQKKLVPLTVDEAERTQDTAKEGLYFYLSVVPDIASPELVKHFEEGTIWKAVPGFVRKVKPRRGVLRDAGTRYDASFADIVDSDGSSSDVDLTNFSSDADDGPIGAQGFSFSKAGEPNSFYPPLRIAAAQSPPEKRRARWINPIARKTCRKGRGSAFGFSAPSVSPPSLGAGVHCLSTKPSLRFPGAGSSSTKTSIQNDVFTDMDWDLEESLIPPARCINSQGKTSKAYAGKSEDISRTCFPMSNDFDKEYNENQRRALGSIHFAASVEVGKTQAGELAYGKELVVSSGYTGNEYAYEHASEPTVLCMSIWEDMKFLPLLDTVEKMLEAEMKEWIGNEGKMMIESLNVIFKEEKCVIDLESEADTIVCTCGHQCINHANISNDITRCPLCRSPITAFVLADGIVI